MGAGTTNGLDFFDSLEGYAYDLLAILEELQVDSCIYVGHSVSIMIGVIAFINGPDLYFKLVFVFAPPRFKFLLIAIAKMMIKKSYTTVKPLSDRVLVKTTIWGGCCYWRGEVIESGSELKKKDRHSH